MKPLSDLFGVQHYTLPSTKKSWKMTRKDLIGAFLDELNPPRIKVGLRPLQAFFLSSFFSERKMTVDQIYCFYKDCKGRNNFSSYFWWSTKPQNKAYDKGLIHR